MAERIDSIYYFDYTKDIGHYDSIRDFASVEMTYIGLALSTPKVRINATPDSFDISSDESARLREYAVSQMENLRKISKDLAVNSPRYILIRYYDGTDCYFEYNEAFCFLFKMALQNRPKEDAANEYVSPYAIQRDESVCTSSYTRQPQPPASAPAAYAPPKVYSQQNANTIPTQQKKKSIPGLVKLFGIAIIITIIAVIVSGMPDNSDSSLTPVSEPRSGEILSGHEVYDESEIMITASGGESCVVKLKTRSGTERMSFYVRAGDTVTVGVPAEYLYVYFATGDTWYGNKHLFGENTSYSMDDEICDFTEYTWEYTLYPVSNGNFSETPIDADDF